MKIIIDERFRRQIPPLSADEYALLEASLKAEGLRDSLIVWKTQEGHVLLDGHTRHEICQRLKITPHIFEMFFDTREQAEDWIDKNQLGRRNLSPDDFRMILGRRYNRQKLPHGGDRKSKDQIDPLKNAAESIAAEHGVSAPTVKRAGQYAAAVDAVTQEQPELAGMGPDAVKEAARKKLYADAEIKRKEKQQERKLSPEEKRRIETGIREEVKQFQEQKQSLMESRISVNTIEGFLKTVDVHLKYCKSRTEKIEHLQDMIKKCREIVVSMQKEKADG